MLYVKAWSRLDRRTQFDLIMGSLLRERVERGRASALGLRAPRIQMQGQDTHATETPTE
jgi:hypothetical protein